MDTDTMAGLAALLEADGPELSNVHARMLYAGYAAELRRSIELIEEPGGRLGGSALLDVLPMTPVIKLPPRDRALHDRPSVTAAAAELDGLDTPAAARAKAAANKAEAPPTPSFGHNYETGTIEAIDAPTPAECAGNSSNLEPEADPAAVTAAQDALLGDDQ